MKLIMTAVGFLFKKHKSELLTAFSSCYGKRFEKVLL